MEQIEENAPMAETEVKKEKHPKYDLTENRKNVELIQNAETMKCLFDAKNIVRALETWYYFLKLRVESVEKLASAYNDMLDRESAGEFANETRKETKSSKELRCEINKETSELKYMVENIKHDVNNLRMNINKRRA
jgi:F0F1-type ATP synthase alpha subunit